MYYVLCCAFANLPNDRMKAHSKTDNYECKQWTLCNGECISSKLANDISFVFAFVRFIVILLKMHLFGVKKKRRCQFELRT